MMLVLSLCLCGEGLVFPVLQDADAAIAEFKKAMRNPDGEARAAAVRRLGGVKGEKVLKILAAYLRRDTSPVRVAAAQAVGSFKERAKEATRRLVSALAANREKEVLAAILKSLGDLGEAGAASAVHAFLDHKETEAAKAAIEAAGKLRQKASVKPLIDLLCKIEKRKGISNRGAGLAGGPKIPGKARSDDSKKTRERQRTLSKACLNALAALTREKFQKGAEWQAWWKKYGAAFKVEK